MSIRIATWNVWWRFGNWQSRHPAIARTLASLDADVITLQEVWCRVDGPDAPDAPVVVDESDAPAPPDSQPADMARALGLPHHRYAWQNAHDGMAFGNAILTRLPILATHVMPLPSGGSTDEGRTALAVEVQPVAGSPVLVATTHLNFLWHHSAQRQVQTAAIGRWLADIRTGDQPVVLTGDLNAVDTSDEVRQLTGKAAIPDGALGFHDAWEVAGDGAGITWSRDNTHAVEPPLEGSKRIDYVLTSYPTWDVRGAVLDARVFGDEPDSEVGHPSDHFGVVADVVTSPRR